MISEERTGRDGRRVPLCAIPKESPTTFVRIAWLGSECVIEVSW
jgi:hypothetical protein